MNANKNDIDLVGIVETVPEYWYTHNEQKDYVFSLKVKRENSGIFDVIRICITEKLLEKHQIKVGDTYHINGQIRTRNIKLKTGPKISNLEVFVFPRYMEKIDGFTEDMYKNECTLFGTIVVKNQFKDKLVSNKVLFEFILASNRRGGEGMYIPCLAWNDNAYKLYNTELYSKIKFRGKFQSRIIKNEKTVYNVSIMELL